MSAAESDVDLGLAELLRLLARVHGDEAARSMEGPILAMQNERDGHGKRRWSNCQIGLKVTRLIYSPGRPDPKVLAQGAGQQVQATVTRVLPAGVTARYAAQAKQALADAAAEREAARLQAEAERRAAEEEQAARDGAA